jgi:VanZ family protein
VVFWGVIGLLLLHGIGSEIGQTYVPGRTGSIRDVLLDWLGIGFGVLALGATGRVFSGREG